MRRASWASIVLPVFVVAALVAAPPAAVQAQSTPSMGRDELMSFAKVYVAIAQARDSIDVRLAQPRNKTLEAQQALRDTLLARIDEILHHSGMTGDEYRRKTYIVSADAETRKLFDGMVSQITGLPTPGQAPPTPPAAPGGFENVMLPMGAVGTHIGHVVKGFSDTPGGQGFLQTALAEAKIAAQHATLAARAPTNLDGMKLHAGHVIHALDPTVVTMGPGLGYGVKKAATGIATHIELAAKVQGASQNVITHSVHIATSARNTVQRVDQIIALAQQVQAATTAAEAAPIISQVVSLSDQLTAGADANADGRITWDQGEGGLQQAQQHLTLMLAAESPPPTAAPGATPGSAPPAAAGGAPVALPLGAVGTHLGHVINAFGDTPGGQGLLPAALAEAKIATTHAGLAARDPANLTAMKLHAGHVIHALDPTVVTTGPGLGYGVKKAATNIATHIELAAKAGTASQNIITHSVHIATSARNTVQRADQIIALAKQVQAATSAADAAPIIAQMVTLCEQLTAGADANADGRITWELGEGGLAQAQQHLTLMLAGEMH